MLDFFHTVRIDGLVAIVESAGSLSWHLLLSVGCILDILSTTMSILPILTVKEEEEEEEMDFGSLKEVLVRDERWNVETSFKVVLYDYKGRWKGSETVGETIVDNI